MSAGPYMLKGEGAGSSSEEETVIVTLWSPSKPTFVNRS